MHTRASFLLLSALLASCAHESTVAGRSTVGSNTEGQPLPPLPDVTGPPSQWSTMSVDDRATYMTEHVLPTMGPLFEAFGPERYDDFSCGTCHGPGARLHHFAMPNPGLPVLPVPESEEWNAMKRERRHAFTFMAERVEPAMAGLLGLQPYDPATQQGFGCFNCHTMAER